MSNIVTRIFNNLGYYKVSEWDGKYFYSLSEGLSSEFWGEKSFAQYAKYFQEIPELNAIINYRAKAESSVRLQIVSKTTGEPVKNNEPLVKILRKPNWFQSQTEFMRQSSIFRSVFGNEINYLLTPTGMGTNYKALFTLPPQMIYIYCPIKYFYLEPTIPKDIQYYFQLPGINTKKELNINDIIHLNDNRISYIPDKQEDDMKMRTNYMWGTSKIASLIPNCENIKTAYEGRNTMRKLPVGVLSNTAKDAAGTAPMNPEEKEKLQGDLKKYGIGLNKLQLILTGMSLNFNETIVDINKLQLYEETKESTQRICDEYGVPYELLGNQTGVTYENKRYAERQMYQDTIIPSMNEKIESYNDKLDTANKSWEIIGTFDHLPIFQENIKERAQSISMLTTGLDKALASGAITVEDYTKELQKFGIGK